MSARAAAVVHVGLIDMFEGKAWRLYLAWMCWQLQAKRSKTRLASTTLPHAVSLHATLCHTNPHCVTLSHTKSHCVTPEVSNGHCVVILEDLHRHSRPQVLRLVHSTKLTLSNL